jgi:hypothetical protein
LLRCLKAGDVLTCLVLGSYRIPKVFHRDVMRVAKLAGEIAIAVFNRDRVLRRRRASDERLALPD